MLSSQTKDTVTAVAMKNLQENLPGGLCLESLLKVEPAELNRLIEKVGFHNKKTKFIKSVATILRDEHDGDIPDTMEGPRISMKGTSSSDAKALEIMVLPHPGGPWRRMPRGMPTFISMYL